MPLYDLQVPFQEQIFCCAMCFREGTKNSVKFRDEIQMKWWMSLGFHEWLWWHVHFVKNVRNDERNYMGNYVWKKIPLLLKALWRNQRSILGFMERHCWNVPYLLIFYPTSKGKEWLGKILIWWKLGVLLFSNELP